MRTLIAGHLVVCDIKWLRHLREERQRKRLCSYLPQMWNGVLNHLQSKYEHVGCFTSSEVKLCPSPVSSASVVPDFVVSLVSDPVRHRSVLLDLLGESYLLSESLNGTLKKIISRPQDIPYSSLLIVIK